MRWLLLLFILSPVILYGQTRQKAFVDSIKAASNNLQRVSKLISNYPGTAVENIQASDSNGFVTVVVRVHVTEETKVPMLSPRAIYEIRTENMVAGKLSAIVIPPLPRFADSVMAVHTLAAYKLGITDAKVGKMYLVAVPPLPNVKEEIETVLSLAAYKLKTEAIPVGKMDRVLVPPLPNIKEEIAMLPLPASFKLKTEAIPLAKMHVVAVPPLPNMQTVIKTLTLAAVSRLKTNEIVVGKMNTAAVPAFPEIGWETALPLAACITIKVEKPPANKIYAVAVPNVEEKRLAVAEMHLSDEGYALLEKMEGFSPVLYSLGDGGFTIGFGLFVPYNEIGKWRKGLTLQEAERLLRQKVPVYEDQVKKYINVQLTQEEFDALTMLAYNIGSFARASSIVNDINTNADFEQLQRDWMRFVHSKAPGVMKGLMNRRRDEMQVRGESNYQPERKIQVLKK
jgi:GH24 family phage-related lysozyme (muramidase)